MTRQLILRPETEEDVHDIYSWYEFRREGLGREFLMELNKVLGSIRKNPEIYPKAHKELRRALMQRFPFAIFYTLRADEIIVSAVFHQARDPKRWEGLA